jgi:hypothetical protein
MRSIDRNAWPICWSFKRLWPLSKSIPSRWVDSDLAQSVVRASHPYFGQQYALSSVPRQTYLQTPRTLTTSVGTALYQGSNPMAAYAYGSTLQGSPISFMQRTSGTTALSPHFNTLSAASQVQYASSYQGTPYSVYTAIKPTGLTSAYDSTGNGRARLLCVCVWWY